MPKQTYTSFNIYEEVFNIKHLSNEHHLMMGVMYNITSKGKHVLAKGVLSSSVNDIIKQNLSRFNLEKRPKNAQWYSYLEELTALGYLRRLTDCVGLSHRPNGSVEIITPNYCITELGLELFKDDPTEPPYNQSQLF